eukprot:3947074-Pleurochrysis_carterae.AAC.1
MFGCTLRIARALHPKRRPCARVSQITRGVNQRARSRSRVARTDRVCRAPPPSPNLRAPHTHE